jgi:ribosomal protein S18 acetylase RimI-like enzyme
MIIKCATFSDIPTIQYIAQNTWPATYGHIISSAQMDYMMKMMYSTASLTRQMQTEHVFYLAEIAEDNTQGFASVSDEGKGIFKLNKLYVIPCAQKTGAGKALLQAVINHVRTAGGKQLQLQVNRHNNAKGFYEKTGFTVLEEKDIHIGDGFYMNDYIMELKIEG